MPALRDLTGQRFGTLLVLRKADEPYISPGGVKMVRWVCKCERCGKEVTMLRNVLMRAKSCGCTKKPRKKNTKTCVICGKEFESPPSSNSVTCSKECRSIRATRSSHENPRKWGEEAKSRAKNNPDVLERVRSVQPLAVTKALENPLNQRGEQNRESKIWHLIDPLGNEIEVINLLNWARENYTQFEPDTDDVDGAARRVSNGFMAIQSTLIGAKSRKNCPIYTYKGWSLTRPSEERQKHVDHQDSANPKWRLVDPAGNIIEVNNLRSWARENYALFIPEADDVEIAARQIAQGFSVIRAATNAASTGRRASHYSYKGWSLEGVSNARGNISVGPESIQLLREKLNVNQVGLAKLLGVTQTTVSHWESGTNRVSKPMAEKILEMLASQENNTTGNDKLIPIKEWAEANGRTINQARKLVRNGRLPCNHRGRHLYIPIDAVPVNDPSHQPREDGLVSISEWAERHGCSVENARNYYYRGRLPAEKSEGKRIWFSPDAELLPKSPRPVKKAASCLSPIPCRVCGKIFVPATTRNIYCSTKCGTMAYRAAHYIPKTAICPACGSEFIRHRGQKYCEKCLENIKQANRHIGDVDHCSRCGKEYVVTGNRQKYCPECKVTVAREKSKEYKRNPAKGRTDLLVPALTGKMRICAACGNAFLARTARQKYCSKCKGK